MQYTESHSFGSNYEVNTLLRVLLISIYSLPSQVLFNQFYYPTNALNYTKLRG
jgi:hypothetical protein